MTLQRNIAIAFFVGTGSKPVFWVLKQNTVNEVTRDSRNRVWIGKILSRVVQDLLERKVFVLSAEHWSPNQHLEHHAGHSPDITSTRGFLVTQNFRRHKLSSTTERIVAVLLRFILGSSEIRNLDVAILTTNDGKSAARSRQQSSYEAVYLSRMFSGFKSRWITPYKIGYKQVNGDQQVGFA